MPPFKLDPFPDDEEAAPAAGTRPWDEEDERKFREWYDEYAKRVGLNPDPDDPRHFYDYRAQFASATPESHRPEFKTPGHPDRYVDEVDTITGAKEQPMDSYINEQYTQAARTPRAFQRLPPKKGGEFVPDPFPGEEGSDVQEELTVSQLPGVIPQEEVDVDAAHPATAGLLGLNLPFRFGFRPLANAGLAGLRTAGTFLEHDVGDAVPEPFASVAKAAGMTTRALGQPNTDITLGAHPSLLTPGGGIVPEMTIPGDFREAVVGSQETGFGARTIEALVQNAPQFLTNFMVRGGAAALAAGGGPAVMAAAEATAGFAVSYIAEKGGAYDQFIEQGYSKDEADTLATWSGLINGGLEQVMPGSTGLFRGYKPFIRGLARLAVGAGLEATTEGAQSLIPDALAALKDGNLEPLYARFGKDQIDGLLLEMTAGGLMGGPMAPYIGAKEDVHADLAAEAEATRVAATQKWNERLEEARAQIARDREFVERGPGIEAHAEEMLGNMDAQREVYAEEQDREAVRASLQQQSERILGERGARRALEQEEMFPAAPTRVQPTEGQPVEALLAAERTRDAEREAVAKQAKTEADFPFMPQAMRERVAPAPAPLEELPEPGPPARTREELQAEAQRRAEERQEVGPPAPSPAIRETQEALDWRRRYTETFGLTDEQLAENEAWMKTQGLSHADVIPGGELEGKMLDELHLRKKYPMSVPPGWTLRRWKKGYIGAKHIKGKKELEEIRRQIAIMAKTGMVNHQWYERSSNAVLDYVHGDVDDAEIFAKFLAVTSAQTDVKSNWRFATEAFQAWKAGEVLDYGRYPVAFGERMRAIVEKRPNWVDRPMHLPNTKDWQGGRKIRNFYNNLMVSIDPARQQGVTVDVWMGRAYGFVKRPKNPKEKVKDWSPTDAQYDFIETEVTNLAKEMGITPYQAQAAIWIAVKSDWEGTSPDAAGYDFGTSLAEHHANISWETEPGGSANDMPELRTAPWGDRIEYREAVMRNLIDEEGNDRVAKELGITAPVSFPALGVWGPRVTPGVQAELQVPIGARGLTPAAKDEVELYTAVMGILNTQDAMGYNVPVWTDIAEDQSAFKVSLNRKSTDGPRGFSRDQLRKISAAVGGDTAIVATRDGAKFLNIGDRENTLWAQRVADVLERVTASDPDIRPTPADRFHNAGSLLMNDWGKDPNGEVYLADLLARRPDLQGRADRVLSIFVPEFDAIKDDFARAKGWTRNRSLNTRYTYPAGVAGPSPRAEATPGTPRPAPAPGTEDVDPEQGQPYPENWDILEDEANERARLERRAALRREPAEEPEPKPYEPTPDERRAARAARGSPWERPAYQQLVAERKVAKELRKKNRAWDKAAVQAATEKKGRELTKKEREAAIVAAGKARFAAEEERSGVEAARRAVPGGAYLPREEAAGVAPSRAPERDVDDELDEDADDTDTLFQEGPPLEFLKKGSAKRPLQSVGPEDLQQILRRAEAPRAAALRKELADIEAKPGWRFDDHLRNAHENAREALDELEQQPEAAAERRVRDANKEGLEASMAQSRELIAAIEATESWRFDPELREEHARLTKGIERRQKMLDRDLYQGARGVAQFPVGGGPPVIRGLTNPDVSTAIHEVSHVARRRLPQQDQRRLERIYGVKDGKWTREQEERFATDAEKYFRGLKDPPKLARPLFSRVRDGLRELGTRFMHGDEAVAGISPEVRAFFDDKILHGTEPDWYGPPAPLVGPPAPPGHGVSTLEEARRPGAMVSAVAHMLPDPIIDLVEPGVVKRFFKKYFNKESLNADSAYMLHETARSEMRGHVNDASQAAVDWYRAEKKNDPKSRNRKSDREALGHFLRGDQSALSNISSEDGRAAALRMRGAINNMQNALLASGMLEPGSAMRAKVEDSIGTYITRQYKAFREPSNWNYKLVEQKHGHLLNNAVKWVQGQLAAENGGVEPSEEDVKLRLKELFPDKADAENPFALLDKVGKKDLGVFMQRKDVPEVLRKLLGEYEDPVVNFVQTYQHVAQVVVNHRMLSELKTVGLREGWLSDKKTLEQDTQFTPAGTAYSPLAGMYGTEDAVDAWNRLTRPKEITNGLARVTLRVMGGLRAMKTVLNPTTHFGNVIGNYPLMLANGNWGAFGAKNAIAWKVAWNAAFDDISKSDDATRALATKLTRLGVIQQSIAASDLRDLIAETGGLGDVFMDPTRSHANKIIGVFGRIAKIYGAEDDGPKALSFLMEYAKYKQVFPNMPEAELEARVADIVKDTMPTWSRINPELRRLRRRFPFGNFASFSMEIIRTRVATHKLGTKEVKAGKEMRARGKETGNHELEAEGRRLERMGYRRKVSNVTVPLMFSGLAELSKALLGISDEEEDKLRRGYAPWERWSPKFYYQRPTAGRSTFVDLNGINPFGALQRPISAAIEMFDEHPDDPIKVMRTAFAELIRPYTDTDFLARFIIENAFGRKVEDFGIPERVEGKVPQLGAILYRENDPENWARFTQRSMEEFALYGAGKRMERSINERVSETGMAGGPWAELLGMMTRLKPVTRDWRQTLKFRRKDYSDDLADAKHFYTGPGNRQGKPDLKVIRDGLHSYVQQSIERQREIFRDIEAARYAGMTEDEITAALTDEALGPWPLGKALIERLMSGTIQVSVPETTNGESIYDELYETAGDITSSYSKKYQKEGLTIELE